MIFINFKTYQQATGVNAVYLAQIFEQVSHETGTKIVAVVQATDIKEVSQKVNIEVWAQIIDPVEYGAHTGAILPEAVLEDGAQGAFLNHSENKMEMEKIMLAVKRADEIGLKTLVFAGDIDELKQIIKLSPTYISYEPAELVGSVSVSVSQAKPEVIKEAAEVAKDKGIPLIVGAGIHSAEDVRKSLDLGASGIVVATNIVKAENPKQALLDLIEGFR